jgi:L-fuconolactonase
MPVIDVQVHAYERNHPGRPWRGHLDGPPSATGEEMVAAMDSVGVDAALLVSSFNLYGTDPSYALEVRAKYPGRFAVIKPVDPTDPAIEDIIADWSKVTGAVGIRVILRDDVSTDPADPAINRTLAAAGRHGLPVNLLCWGRLAQASALMARHPDTVVVVDHLGLRQPFQPPAPPDAWADLANVLDLARHANARMKISGACTLSREPYPYSDIWDPVCRIIDAFGLDRCMWGTDWTRATALLTFREGVEAFRVTHRLTDGDRAALMGGTVEKVYRWSPS